MSKKLETDIEQLKQQVELMSNRLDSLASIILMQIEIKKIKDDIKDDLSGNGNSGGRKD